MTPSKSPLTPDEKPEIPGLPSWASVYLLVAGLFVLIVALLSILPLIAR